MWCWGSGAGGDRAKEAHFDRADVSGLRIVLLCVVLMNFFCS